MIIPSIEYGKLKNVPNHQLMAIDGYYPLDDYSQYMENKKCSKSPTRCVCIYIYNVYMDKSSQWDMSTMNFQITKQDKSG